MHGEQAKEFGNEYGGNVLMVNLEINMVNTEKNMVNTVNTKKTTTNMYGE